MPRIQLNCAGVVRDRPVDFFVGPVNQAAIIGILWRNLNCLGEIGNRSIAIALRLEGTASAKIGVSVQWIDFNCFAVISDCL